MQVFKHNELRLPSSIVSIGAFDGLHVGHQTLIKRASKRARELNLPSVVYTFNPPPRAYFQNHLILTNIKEKINLINQLDIDYVVVADFNKQYASRPASEFIREISCLGPKELWVGPNFQFGKGKKGNTKLLSEYFHVKIHPIVTCENGEVISSTRIRKLLQEDNWKQVNKLLGRHHMEIIKS